jgi:hypothetical protein
MWKCSECGNELKFIGKAEFDVGFDANGNLDDEHEMLGYPDYIEVMCEHCDLFEELDEMGVGDWLLENAVWADEEEE